MPAKISNRTLTKTKVSQTIDLQEEFGVDFTGNKGLKEKIGQLLIDRMLDRTASSKDVNGNGFKPYSKEYKSSSAFEKYGKTSKVNMELRSDMLDDIDIKNIKANTIDIAITDSLQKKKAYNHNVGDTLPKREFFGVTKGDIEAVKKEISGDLKALGKKTPSLASVVGGVGAIAGQESAVGALVAEALFGEGEF